MNSKPAGERNVQSVLRALSIMEFIADNEDLAGITEISRAIGLSKSTVHGLVATLQQKGYVEQLNSGKYRLGLKLFELGQVVHSAMDLRLTAMPILQDLVDKHRETVHLAVLSQTNVVYIDKINSPRSITIMSRVGGHNPAYCTGVGKVLLADLADAALDELYGGQELVKRTAKTIVDLEELKFHLRRVKMQGYGLDLEEFDSDTRCISAPIKNYQGKVLAACSLSGPTTRLADDKLPQIIDDVRQAGQAISLRLGYKE